VVAGFGRVEKNIIFNRFRVVSDWHNCLSLNQMAGNLLIIITGSEPGKAMNRKKENYNGI